MRIVVLDVWGLHLGYLGCYGNEWVATPNLDGLAAQAVVFDQHLADRPILTPGGEAADSVPRSAWTGRYHLPSPEGPDPEGGGPESLAGFFKEQGVPFVCLRERGGGDSGWKRIGKALEDLAGWEKGLFWIDLLDLVPPWETPEDFLEPYFEGQDPDEAPLQPWPDPAFGPVAPEDLERLQYSYAAAVTHLDFRLGLLRKELRKRKLWKGGIFCLTSSGGLALGEHGLIGPHRAWLHDEVIHVPLIVRLPGGAEAGLRVGALTQPPDLFPTFQEALGLSSRPAHGQSLWPLIRGEKEQVRPYACAGLRVGEGLEWALRTPEWAFLLPLAGPKEDPPRKPQLYARPDDRWEVNDVSQHHLELVEQMEKTLRAFAGAARSPGPFEMPELKAVEPGEAAGE